MKCCSRSTLGVVIGILSIVCCIGFSIYFVTKFHYLRDYKEYHMDGIYEYRRRSLTITILMVVLVLMVLLMIISGLFIIGIIKRRHKLMLPWLFISAAGFISHATIYLVFLVRVLSQEFDGFLVLLFLGTFATGLQGLIWWTIYTLYSDIRTKSDKRNGRVFRESQVNHDRHIMPDPSQTNYYAIRNDH